MDGNMKYVLGESVSNFTIIKDGVDLKSRFQDVLDNHPLTYHWSDGVKKMISLKFYDEVMKDA
jgi:type II secretory pathway component GspD/PulD (secretin)